MRKELPLKGYPAPVRRRPPHRGRSRGPVEAEDIVSLKTGEHAFKANGTVFNTAKWMEERLLDILA